MTQTQVFEVVAVAPMKPTTPCFGTPIFREAESGNMWYQIIGPDQLIAGFDEVADDLKESLLTVKSDSNRVVGQPALFAYLPAEMLPQIGERAYLRQILVNEFYSQKDRCHLRYAIAKFLGDHELITIAQPEVDAWRLALTSRFRDRNRALVTPTFESNFGIAVLGTLELHNLPWRQAVPKSSRVILNYKQLSQTNQSRADLHQQFRGTQI